MPLFPWAGTCSSDTLTLWHLCAPLALLARKTSMNFSSQLSLSPLCHKYHLKFPPFPSSVVSRKPNLFQYCTQQTFPGFSFPGIWKWEAALGLLLAEEADQFVFYLLIQLVPDLKGSLQGLHFILHWQQFHMIILNKIFIESVPFKSPSYHPNRGFLHMGSPLAPAVPHTVGWLPMGSWTLRVLGSCCSIFCQYTTFSLQKTKS